MTESATPIDAPEQSLADYIREANAAEREDRPIDPAPASTSATETPGESPRADAAGTPESVEPVKEPEGERNPDGTFKPRSKKSEARAEDVPRIRELTAKLRQAERERDEARQQPAQTAPAQPAGPVIIGDGKFVDYDGQVWDFSGSPDTWADQFLKISTDPWMAAQPVIYRWQAQQQRMRDEAQQARSSVLSRIQTFAADHPDYGEKLNAISDERSPDYVGFNQAVTDAIADSDLGPAVAYHLANNIPEARRIAALRPLAGVREIGKLEDRLSAAPSGPAPQAAPVSKAKGMIKPVVPTPNAPESPPPEDLPFGRNYIRQMNAKERAEAHRGL